MDHATQRAREYHDAHEVIKSLNRERKALERLIEKTKSLKALLNANRYRIMRRVAVIRSDFP